jgi:hypothetical protein
MEIAAFLLTSQAKMPHGLHGALLLVTDAEHLLADFRQGEVTGLQAAGRDRHCDRICPIPVS